jgi:hypothetical protein
VTTKLCVALVLPLLACKGELPPKWRDFQQMGTTSLVPDCRLEIHADAPACTGEPVPGTLGGGAAFPGEVVLAFVDGDSAYVGFELSGVAALFEVDLMTGDRALVTGAYEDPATGRVERGAGPPLDAIGSAAMGDGALHLHTGDALYAVDLATGDRTLVVDDATLCTVGATAETASASLLRAMTVAEDGTIYIARNFQSLVAVNGTSCRIVSAAEREPFVGTGPTLSGDYEGLVVLGDSVFALTERGEVVRIDPSAGDWRVVSALDVGEGPSPIGEYIDRTLDDRSLVTTGSGLGRLGVVIELATGDRTELAQPDVTRALGSMRRAVPWPSEPGIWVHAREGVELVDPASKNAVWVSY